MIKKLTEKIKEQKTESIQYNFKEKHEGIAGTCPDCGSIVSYNSFFHRYVCINLECEFEADIKRERVVKKLVSNNQEIENKI